MDFGYCVPFDLKFGRGKADHIGEEISRHGRRPLIVTGKSSAKTGLLEKVEGQLEALGMEYHVFDKVSKNPLTTTVEEGAETARSSGCDCILALGGGSPMDASKGIALMACNPGEDIHGIMMDGFGGRRLTALPIVAVPTTCGTGSECNGTAILSDPVTKDKKGIRDNVLIPRCSVVDPSLMETMPPETLSAVTFDALCHSMESYLSPRSNPVTEPTSLTCMATLSKYIVRVNDDIYDEEALDAVTLASSLVGSAFYASSLIAPHGLEHPLSGLRDMVHGRGLAALTPVIFRHSCMCSAPKFSIVSKLLGGNDETDCARQVEMLLGRIGLDVYLSDEGFCEDDIPWLVDNAFRVSKARIEDNPKVFGREEIAEIYREAM